ncbi:MAG TPA: hypothetical protein VHK67_05965 [Rhabdochlamydiaceae bacterium]|jgi:hypothetical protein|nr:hypothetical protein [Rhabdochlamydiaceae bacterium]
MLSQHKPTQNFSVSKWLKHQVLLDYSEMQELCGHLCSHLAPFHFFNVSEIKPLAELELSLESFLKSYQDYIGVLKAGKIPLERQMQRNLSCALTIDSNLLYAQPIGTDKFMAKPLKPVVQMQQHRFFFSKTAETIHPMVMSHESIHWGVQLAYPQIFFDGAAYSKVSDETLFPNTALFTKLVKWLRSSTVPTTFVRNSKKISTPIRMGKRCFPWIQNHVQLKEQGIAVHVY